MFSAASWLSNEASWAVSAGAVVPAGIDSSLVATAFRCPWTVLISDSTSVSASWELAWASWLRMSTSCEPSEAAIFVEFWALSVVTRTSTIGETPIRLTTTCWATNFVGSSVRPAVASAWVTTDGLVTTATARVLAASASTVEPASWVATWTLVADP